MKWIHVNNYDEMSKQAALIFKKQIEEKPDSVLGLATGGTPIGFYQELIKLYQQGLSFSKVKTFNLDEYVGISPQDVTSYHTYMQEHLFRHIDTPSENIHLPNGLADDLDAECKRYEAAIAACEGIDLQLLGIGVNGHIGFNEPGTAFSSTTHVVTLAEQTRLENAKYFPEGQKVPEQAITMGIKTIMGAKKIVLLAFGENKMHTLQKLREGSVTEDIPASRLKEHPNVEIIYGR